MVKEEKILKKATENGVITESQYSELAKMFSEAGQKNGILSFSNILYYFGGFLAITAISIFMTLSYSSFGELGLLTITSLLFVTGLLLSAKYKGLYNNIPSGVFSAFAICAVPLIIYCIQVLFGMFEDSRLSYGKYFDYIKWNWVYMELGTLLVASILMYKDRFPFMMLPVAVSMWFLSMDLSILLLDYDYWNFDLRRQVSMVFGLLTIGFAMCINYRTSDDKDYAFWLYLFGVTSFWCGLSLSDSNNELTKFAYFLINIMLLFMSVILSRKIFAVFGSIGSLLYIGYLSNKLFKDQLLFSLALIIIGFIIIRLGMYWNKNSDRFEKKLKSCLPDNVNEILLKLK
jgi:hypothetical protein